MGTPQDFILRLTHATPERRASRSYLKQAKKGDPGAFLSLAANYLDLAIVYFGGCLREAEAVRYDRVEQVFKGLWQHLPYAERVSDFEFMLANALIENTPEHGSLRSPEPLITKLRLLEPKTRFAFIAHELEKWPLRWVSLVMRLRPLELHSLLSEARCELCGVSWQSLAEDERACLEAISVALDASPNLRINKALCERVATFPRVSQIKALWLELRPELVEVRHRYLPDSPNRDGLLANILRAAETAPMNQPGLVDRFVNTVQFKRHATIKVS
ncbi:MAG: hypothetical protein GVY36_08890 [Verrucomicrobia bacterium]|jgi:hypothetical protein|nr:hypothetical protein [Verrucomicrobiota bacterium]